MRRDVEVDVTKLVAWVAKKWKKILVVGFICAIVVNLLLVYVSINGGGNAQDGSTDDIDWSTVLTEKEMADAEASAKAHLESHETMREIKKYMQESVRYQLDPSKVSTYTLIWRISGAAEKNALVIAEHYEESLVTDELSAAIKNKLNWDLKNSLVDELITVENTFLSTESGINSTEETLFMATVIANNREECETIASEVRARVENITQSLKATYNAFDCTFVNEVYEENVDKNLFDYKAWILSNYNNVLSLSKTLNSTFTEKQNEYFMQLIEEKEETEEENEEQTGAAVTEVQWINAKGLILGFGLGAVMAVCYFAVMYLIDGKVRSSQEMAQMLNLPVFEEKDKELLLLQVKSFLNKKKLGSLYVMETAEGISTELNFDSLENVKIVYEQGDKSFSEHIAKAANCEGVLLVCQRETSKIKDVKSLYDKLEMSENQVVGLVIIE